MSSLKIEISTPQKSLSSQKKESVSEFLYQHLEQYGDKKPDIQKAIDYAMDPMDSKGGFVVECFDDNKLVGAVTVNKTGMSGYIPENILVYIAVHNEARGKGVGRRLMKKAIEFADGDIALHVEPTNPAKFLYEKLGFTNKYLEMRYTKSDNG